LNCCSEARGSFRREQIIVGLELLDSEICTTG
jgi:hypothetical protein